MTDPILQQRLRAKPKAGVQQLHAAARRRMQRGVAPRSVGRSPYHWSNNWSASEHAARTRQKTPSDVALPPAGVVPKVGQIPMGHRSDKEQQDRLEGMLLRQIARAGRGSRQRAAAIADLEAWRQQGRPTAEDSRIAIEGGSVKAGETHLHTRGEVGYANEVNHPEGVKRHSLDRLVERLAGRGYLGKLSDGHIEVRRMRRRWRDG